MNGALSLDMINKEKEAVMSLDLQTTLFVLFGTGILWIYYVVAGGFTKTTAPTNDPHVLVVVFENGYKTEFFCDSFDQGLRYLDRLDGVTDCSLIRYEAGLGIRRTNDTSEDAPNPIE